MPTGFILTRRATALACSLLSQACLVIAQSQEGSVEATQPEVTIDGKSYEFNLLLPKQRKILIAIPIVGAFVLYCVLSVQNVLWPRKKFEDLTVNDMIQANECGVINFEVK